MAEDAAKPDVPSEPAQGQPMRLFSITEEDLVELERTLPDICHSMYVTMNNRHRVQFRRLREILADIRWNYGPPGTVIVVRP